MPGRRSSKKKKSKKPRKQKFVEKEEDVKAPHSFVIKRGIITKPVTELMTDFRQILEPFTASNLKVRKQNVVKDFVAVASALSVTHIAMFTMTDQAVYLKLCRLPRGPTITFKIREFTNARDVRSSLRKPVIFQGLFRKQPLLVMNGFSGESMELKLTSSMWRNMFPAFDINTVDLNDIRRCLLLNFDEEKGCMYLRHYAIRVKPVGLAKGTRKIVTSKRIPDLGRFKDIGDFMNRDNAGSATESEGEADEVEEFRQVTLTQKIRTRGNLINEKSAIRLTEIGPRMTMQLFKIEEGLMEGEVLFHSVIKKTKKESKQLADRKKKKQEEKAKRKAEQEANVMAKRMKGDAGTSGSGDGDNKKRKGILKNATTRTTERDKEEEEKEQSVGDKNQDDDDEMHSHADDDSDKEEDDDGAWEEVEGEHSGED